jgi:hypothetical protein
MAETKKEFDIMPIVIMCKYCGYDKKDCHCNKIFGKVFIERYKKMEAERIEKLQKHQNEGRLLK